MAERIRRAAEHMGRLYKEELLTGSEFAQAKAALLSSAPAPPAPVRAPAVPRVLPPPPPPAAGQAAAATATSAAPVQMTDQEKFLYDLQGFLHVPGHLSTAEVAQLNAAFDANWGRRHTGVGGRQNEFTGMLEWPQPHCGPFRELLAHPASLPYLNTQFGQVGLPQTHTTCVCVCARVPCVCIARSSEPGRCVQGWRMDHGPFMITGTAGADGENPAKGGGIHGSTSQDPGGAAFCKRPVIRYESHDSVLFCLFDCRRSL